MSPLASHLTHHPAGCGDKVHMGEREARRAARRMTEYHGEDFEAYPCRDHRGRHWLVGTASWQTVPGSKAGRR